MASSDGVDYGISSRNNVKKIRAPM